VVVGKGIRSSEQPQKKNRTAFFVDKRETEKRQMRRKKTTETKPRMRGVYM